MDNITHLLAGVLVAEISICVRERQKPAENTSAGFRKAAYFTSLLSNNLPDFDFIYARGDRPLGYLLHHRGHTHTVPIALLLGLVGFGLVLGLARWRKWTMEARDGKRLLAVSLVGVLLHILLDSANNYGVHPFWPIYDGWFYGDAFFIIEPFFWAALIAPLLFNMQRTASKIVLGGVLVFGIGLCWFSGMVPRSMAATLTLLSLTLGWFGERLNAERRVMLACSAFAVIAALLIAGSASAKKHVKASLQANFPRAQTHELVLTPMPANPVCWSVLAVQTESLRYVVRSATSSVLPFWFSSSECVFGTERRGTAHSQLIAVAAEPKLRYLREFSVPLNQISELLNAHCRAAAFMRFSRVPFLTEYPSIGRVMLDLRYDRTEALEFAEFSLADRNCPKWIPPWLPPRSELLNQPTP